MSEQGNAYSFGAKVGVLRPEHAIILSTQKIGADAREHFERARLARNPRKGMEFRFSSEESPELYYIEGLEQLPVELQKFAGGIYREDAARILSRVLPFATVNAESLLSAFDKEKA